MKLSRTSQYAIQALVQLSGDRSKPPKSCRILAERGGDMPERFLLQIMRTLVNKGLVHSTRGVDGGYRLAKPLIEITLADVIEACDGLRFEQPTELAAVLSKRNYQMVAGAFGQIYAEARRALGSVTLASLAKPQTS